MTTHLLPWILGVTLAAVHFAGEELDEFVLPYQRYVTGFATGVTVAYVFLQLLPHHHRGVVAVGNSVFLFGLAGFSAMHLSKRYIQRHDQSYEALSHDFKELHSVFLFVYYFAIGLLLTQLLETSVVQGTLFFIPVLFHTSISSLALTELHEEALDNLIIKIAISLSVLLGIAVASTQLITPLTFHSTLGIITGMFLYVVIHDSLPHRGEGSPAAYTAGTVLYTLVIVWTWTMI